MTTIVLRPRLRGVIHYYAFFVSVMAGATLVNSTSTPTAYFGASVYCASLSLLLGTSALYHRVTWAPRARRMVGRLDHSMISILIAGTYTPFGLTAAPGSTASRVLLPIWITALAAIILHNFWYDAPKWLSAVIYVATGWLAIFAMPSLIEQWGWAPATLLLTGGIFYSGGALVYAMKRPDPNPSVFGYHEVFHSLVVVAALAHFVAVALTTTAS